MWYAKTDADTVIATGESFRECSERAQKVYIQVKPGPLPYYLTTIPPGVTSAIFN